MGVIFEFPEEEDGNSSQDEENIVQEIYYEPRSNEVMVVARISDVISLFAVIVHLNAEIIPIVFFQVLCVPQDVGYDVADHD
jgi:hypothetical protein